MKKILIPTDFSPSSELTIDFIVKLFQHEMCEYYFLNSYTYNISGLNAIELLQADEEFFDKPKEESLHKLGALIERHTQASTNGNHSFHALSENTKLVDAMKGAIKNIGIDLVVIAGNSKNKLGRRTKIIIDKIRSCPILVVPPKDIKSTKNSMTIVSDFKRRMNTLEINSFIKTFENNRLDINILVLEPLHAMTVEAKANLNSLTYFLNQFDGLKVNVEFKKASSNLKDYALSHSNSIICIMDKKPDLLRKMGLYQSNAIATLGQFRSNTVLTIHQ